MVTPIDEVCLEGLPASTWCTWIELAESSTYLMMSPRLIPCSSPDDVSTFDSLFLT